MTQLFELLQELRGVAAGRWSSRAGVHGQAQRAGKGTRSDESLLRAEADVINSTGTRRCGSALTEDFESLLAEYELTAEEQNALRDPDIGLLYVMGVNGQILMHYAALRGFEWNAYIEAMREGERKYGPVRTGPVHAGSEEDDMSLVFAGVCSHAPGITGRKDRADPVVRDAFYAAYDRMRQALEAARPDALVVIGAEHFANFFMNNMPAICVGMGEHYEGPIEDEAWLGIKRARFPGARRCPWSSSRT